MEKLGKISISILTLAFFLALSFTANAQCAKFTDSTEGGRSFSTLFHLSYLCEKSKKPQDLDQISEEDRKIAFEYWEKAYKVAPAADGQRPTIWRDGRTFYKHRMLNETDEAKRKEYYDTVLRLYDEEAACFTSKGNDAIQLGRKAFDMFYGLGPKGKELRSSYDVTQKVLANAIEKGGNNTEYIVFVPYANVVVYQFTNEKMDKATARGIYKELNDIADHNIANNEQMKTYYEQAKASMNGTFATIENNIFDCDYFKAKLEPDFDGNQENPEWLKSSITILKRQGCEEGDVFLAKLEGNWAKYAAEENARRQAEFEANNPAVMAKKLYDQGDYSGAIAKYNDALADETDDAKKADYYFRIASIQGRKLSKYNDARSNALKAAKLRSGWGRPYMLIGDLYAKSSRNCGSDGYTRGLAVLAAIDKYSYAKSIDPEVAGEANKRIGSYRKSIPEKGDVFMRGKDGKTDKVPCWIGETVKVRYQ